MKSPLYKLRMMGDRSSLQITKICNLGSSYRRSFNNCTITLVGRLKPLALEQLYRM